MSARSQQRFYFPQDEIWKNASQIELNLLKANGRWFVTYEVKGTIGKDPFDGDEDEDGGGLAEPKEVDAAAVVQSIVAELMKEKSPA